MPQVSHTSAKLAFSLSKPYPGCTASTLLISAALITCRDVEIAFAQPRRPDANGLVGKTCVQRVAVRIAVNGDRRIPSSLHAQMIRRAISPRLAIKIFLNMEIDGSGCPTHFLA